MLSDPLLGHTEDEMALTDTALKALKPRDKTYTVTDDSR